MDAGIPLREHVAGVSVGLVTQLDSTGAIKNYRILTDILVSISFNFVAFHSFIVLKILMFINAIRKRVASFAIHSFA